MMKHVHHNNTIIRNVMNEDVEERGGEGGFGVGGGSGGWGGFRRGL